MNSANNCSPWRHFLLQTTDEEELEAQSLREILSCAVTVFRRKSKFRVITEVVCIMRCFCSALALTFKRKHEDDWFSEEESDCEEHEEIGDSDADEATGEFDTDRWNEYPNYDEADDCLSETL